MNDTEINEKIKESVSKILEETDKHVLVFNRECAIQARLYRYICESIDEWEPKHEVVFHKFVPSKDINFISKDVLKKDLFKEGIKQKISRVQLEYFGGQGQAVDLAILDKEDLKFMERLNFEKSKVKEHIKLSHAIEIKFFLGGESNKSGLLENDLKKLRGYREQGRANYLHFIFICRWPTKRLSAQKEIMRIKKEIQIECTKEPKIEFYTNSHKLYFYPYENKVLE